MLVTLALPATLRENVAVVPDTDNAGVISLMYVNLGLIACADIVGNAGIRIAQMSSTAKSRFFIVYLQNKNFWVSVNIDEIRQPFVTLISKKFEKNITASQRDAVISQDYHCSTMLAAIFISSDISNSDDNFMITFSSAAYITMWLKYSASLLS